MDPQRQAVLDQFGQKVIAEVRDEALEHLQRVIQGVMRDAASKQLFQDTDRFLKRRPKPLIAFLLLQ